jgi:HEAT repeat protein
MQKISMVIISLLFLVSYCAAEIDKTLVLEAKGIIAAGMRSTDDRIRANAVEAVPASEDSKLAGEAAALLVDPSVIVKFSAAVVLGDMNQVQYKENLTKLTNDKDLNVVLASSYALCKMGDEQYYKKILAIAENEQKNQTATANAAMLLGKLGKKEALPILYKIKDDSESSNAAAFNATEAIARLGDEKIYKKIWTMLISVFSDDRYMGAQAMAALGGTKGAGALASLLDDDVNEVKIAAAGQLGTLGDKSGSEVIKKYLSGPPPQEKEVADRCNVLAAIAIGQIKDENLAGYLPKMLKNNNPLVQLAAAKSILMIANTKLPN